MEQQHRQVVRIFAALIDDDLGRLLLVRKAGTASFMQAGGKIEAEDLVAAIQCAIAQGGAQTDIYEDDAYAYSIAPVPGAGEQWLIFRKTDDCLRRQGWGPMLDDDFALFSAYG